VQDGYDITPHLPMTTFSLCMPQVGVASQPGLLRGYVVTQANSVLVMHVSLPPGAAGHPVQAFADGQPVSSTMLDGLVTFSLPAQAGANASWAVES
jgi:hypothetical protein